VIRKEQQERILRLAYGEQWPLCHIAAYMGLSYTTVRHVVARAAILAPGRGAVPRDRSVSFDDDRRAPEAMVKGGAP
jgi:Sigma-70, region 4